MLRGLFFLYRTEKLIKKCCKWFIAYCSLLISAIELFINSLFFAAPAFYEANAFIIYCLFGMSLFCDILMGCQAVVFKYCRTSVACIVAQFVILVVYIKIKSDNACNIVIQCILLTLAIVITFIRINSNKKEKIK